MKNLEEKIQHTRRDKYTLKLKASRLIHPRNQPATITRTIQDFNAVRHDSTDSPTNISTDLQATRKSTVEISVARNYCCQITSDLPWHSSNHFKFTQASNMARNSHKRSVQQHFRHVQAQLASASSRIAAKDEELARLHGKIRRLEVTLHTMQQREGKETLRKKSTT